MYIEKSDYETYAVSYHGCDCCEKALNPDALNEYPIFSAFSKEEIIFCSKSCENEFTADFMTNEDLRDKYENIWYQEDEELLKEIILVNTRKVS